MSELLIQQNSYFKKQSGFSPQQLRYMAFTGQFEFVYSLFKNIEDNRRTDYLDKYILSQVIWGGIDRIEKLRSVQDSAAINSEIEFVGQAVQMFINTCRSTGSYPRELFNSLLYWAEELIKLACPEQALKIIDEALSDGIEKFPAIRIRFLIKKAGLLINKGEKDIPEEILKNLIAHPYLITDRNLIPEILFSYSQVCLLKGNFPRYTRCLFLGLRYFYSNGDDRRKFVIQLKNSFKKTSSLLAGRGIKISDKFLYLIHLAEMKLPDFRKIKLGLINKSIRILVLVYVYFINYLRKGEMPDIFIDSDQRSDELIAGNKNNILITRAMGGIGDLLMMTPGIHALKNSHPSARIDLAVPKRYFPVFENNPDINLIDIENSPVHHPSYKKWFNFSDCPAARIESRTAPKVKKSRIEIFAKALKPGIRFFKNIDHKPRYFLTPEEIYFAQKFWAEHNLNHKNVIGIQLHSDESYRDFPHMEELIINLSDENLVLVFDSEKITGLNFPNIIKADKYTIRECFALVSKCNLIVAPDSSFVHLAAAFDIPTIALFGPIDGFVRTKHYPNCTYIDASENFNCISCWRNETIPCKLTGTRVSVCMDNIKINKIAAAVNEKLKEISDDKHQ